MWASRLLQPEGIVTYAVSLTRSFGNLGRDGLSSYAPCRFLQFLTGLWLWHGLSQTLRSGSNISIGGHMGMHQFRV